MKTDHIDLIAKSVLNSLGAKEANEHQLLEMRQIIAAFLPDLAAHVAGFVAPSRGVDPVKASNDASTAYCLHAFGTDP